MVCDGRLQLFDKPPVADGAVCNPKPCGLEFLALFAPRGSGILWNCSSVGSAIVGAYAEKDGASDGDIYADQRDYEYVCAGPSAGGAGDGECLYVCRSIAILFLRLCAWDCAFYTRRRSGIQEAFYGYADLYFIPGISGAGNDFPGNW